jgi:stage II sporulation protein R
MITLATLFLTAMPTEAECAIYEDTVRLHILANSDSESDQAQKLYIRDELLLEFGEELSSVENVEEAEATLRSMLPEIKRFTDDRLAKYGSDYTSEVTLGREWYNTRVYEEFTLPAGYYSSLIIKIEEGAGKNWWCVMYPPLCLDASLSDVEYTEEEKSLIVGKYNVKFKILELISEISR